jgi:DNA polymerase-3 subunit alpha
MKKYSKIRFYVNKILLDLGKKHKVKCLATNDVHFINPEDAQAHDRLICLSTGKDLDDPTRMKYTEQEWFKTQQEMRELFADLPEVILNTSEVLAKIEDYDLNRKPILPIFPLPESFTNEDDYLQYLTMEGAKKRYGEITEAIQEKNRL